MGTVTGTGIGCGTDCSENYVYDDVTLTATPDASSTFAGWGGERTRGAGCDMLQTTDVTATFDLEDASSHGWSGCFAGAVSGSGDFLRCTARRPTTTTRT